MIYIEILVAWLRQRADEADTAWIERVAAVFQAGSTLQEDATDRIGERRWKRSQARLKAEKSAK